MGFVVSEGSLRSLNRLDLPPAARLQLSDTLSEDYYQIWRKQPAVRIVVTFLARNIAQLGLHSFRRRGDADRERLTDHPLAQLFQRPNGWTTRYRLIDALVHDLGIWDCAYWQKVKTADGIGLIRLPPRMMQPKGDSWLYPDYFEFSGTKGKKQFPADQVVFFRGYNGDTDVGGVSPIEALRDALSEAHAASKMRDQVLRNGARTSGYLERPKDAPKWSDEAATRFKTSWQAQYAGDGPRAGGTPILEEGMTFRPAAQTAKDLQYIESRKLTREEVAAAYFIPPPMVGLLDHASFSNITEQHKMLYMDTLGPWLTMITEEIQLQLVPDLPDPTDVYLEFNLREKMSGSFEERAQSMQTAVGGPYITVNEARAMDNRPPVDGGDDLIRPLNVTQNGDPNPIPAEPGADPNDDPPEPSEPDDDEDEQED